MELCGVICGVDRYAAVWCYLQCRQVWSCVVLFLVWTGMELCGVMCGVDRYGAVWCYLWYRQAWNCVVLLVVQHVWSCVV